MEVKYSFKALLDVEYWKKIGDKIRIKQNIGFDTQH